MFDRWGNKVIVGWAHHEIVWVEAALCLPPAQQIDAYLDIGELTGRGAQAVRRMAQHILDRRRLAESIKEAERQAVRDAARVRHYVPVVMPSELRRPTKAQLMGRRA